MVAEFARNFKPENDISFGYVLKGVKERSELEQGIKMSNSSNLDVIEDEIADSNYMHILSLLNNSGFARIETLDALEELDEALFALTSHDNWTVEDAASLGNSRSSSNTQSSYSGRPDDAGLHNSYSTFGLDHRQPLQVYAYMQTNSNHKWYTIV